MSEFTAGMWLANQRANRSLSEAEQSAWSWRNYAEEIKRQLDAANRQIEAVNANAVKFQLQVAQEQQEKLQLQAELESLTLVSARNRIAGQAAQEMARELRSHIAEHYPADPQGRKEVVSARLDKRRRALALEAGYQVLPGEEFEIAR